MTFDQVVEKLGKEMADRLNILIENAIENSDLSILRENAPQLCKNYIHIALSVGMDHFHPLDEEIIAMDREGVELGRFKSVTEAEIKLGIHKSAISECLNGNRHTAGGLMFLKTKDKELMDIKKIA
jgi:hypothetical protein